jgi:putative transposase
MKDNKERYNRHSIRLKEYDYSQSGGYFITLCSDKGKFLFGSITNAEMRLNESGKIVKEFWFEIPQHFPNVLVDEFVVMPNHIHGIIFIEDCRGGVNPPKQRGEQTSPLRKRTLGQIVAFFKYRTTKLVIQNCRMSESRIWQRNFYEHVIRNEDDLKNIREYVINNPLKWELDNENPLNKKA